MPPAAVAVAAGAGIFSGMVAGNALSGAAAAARSRRGFTVRGGGMLRTASATSLPLLKIDNNLLGLRALIEMIDQPIQLLLV